MLTADIPEPSSDSFTPESHGRMWALLGDLPRQQRAVLVLRFYEGLDDDAIALLIGCSPVTVRSHSSKGLATLRARWPTPLPSERTNS